MIPPAAYGPPEGPHPILASVKQQLYYPVARYLLQEGVPQLPSCTTLTAIPGVPQAACQLQERSYCGSVA
jgi:hypothetical protein